MCNLAEFKPYFVIGSNNQHNTYQDFTNALLHEMGFGSQTKMTVLWNKIFLRNFMVLIVMYQCIIFIPTMITISQ